MDTNIRFVERGNDLFLIGRKVSVSNASLTHDQLQSVCSILKNRSIAATPFVQEQQAFLIIEHRENFKETTFDLDSGDNRTQLSVTLKASNETIKFELRNERDRKTIEELYARQVQINIVKTEGLRIIKKSPNVYYDRTPILSEEDMDNDIVAYQRFFVFTEYFENRGLGFGVDVGTSYFTKHSVEYYFSTGREERFYQLKERQSTEYKGTLLYKGPNGHSRCYFDRYDGKTTLSTTDPFTFKGERYQNSYEYFKKLYPHFEVLPDDNVAYVSFKGMGTLPVPAKFLHLTVATDNLTEDINQQDKYSAQQKRNLIDEFWKRVGNPLGNNYQKLQREYYMPMPGDGGIFDMPAIVYADGHELQAPKFKNAYIYKKYFLQKYHQLKESGCFYVPPMLEREVHFVLPEFVSDKNAEVLINDLTRDVSLLTRKNIDPIDHYYKKGEHLSALYDLKNNYQKGTVVFVFDNHDPAIYYNISQELQGWKIIRLTVQELKRKFNKLQHYPRGKNQWEAYISLNSFKVVSELGCAPYMFKDKLHYEAQLVIDVSENFNHFGLGLLIYKQGMAYPLFDYIIKPNPDAKNDLINPLLLEKYLTELLSRYHEEFKKYDIRNLLVLRDGKENRSEYEVFKKVVDFLKSDKGHYKLDSNFDFLFIEYHKKSMKSIRFFEFYKGEFKNPLEGSWLKINRSTAILMNTGEGTLTQGTASPILIKSNYKTVDLSIVLRDIFLTSQLNFGSPRVAQRLTYLAKKIDNLLKEKRAQEVIKIK
ncbi:MAG TPA: hypothetical protein VHN59_06860 [Chitinophagaceae bacterium]|nr:hypothetical protein [Chitinophagaceae bacterium]